MTESRLSEESDRDRIRRRTALVALIVGVATAWIGVFFLLLLAGVELVHQGKTAANLIFGSYVVLGLGMAAGAWRMRARDGRGFYATFATAALATVLSGACLVQALIVRRSFEYNLMGFTLPLVSYVSLMYALLRAGPPSDHWKDVNAG